MDWKLQEKEFRNSKAHLYDSTTLKEYRFFHPLIKKYLDNLKSQGAKLILDYGCGTGRVTFLTHSLGFNIVCMDISVETLKRIRYKRTLIKTIKIRRYY
jgi:SAM-dependent methyltransferase